MTFPPALTNVTAVEIVPNDSKVLQPNYSLVLPPLAPTAGLLMRLPLLVDSLSFPGSRLILPRFPLPTSLISLFFNYLSHHHQPSPLNHIHLSLSSQFSLLSIFIAFFSPFPSPSSTPSPRPSPAGARCRLILLLRFSLFPCVCLSRAALQGPADWIRALYSLWVDHRAQMQISAGIGRVAVVQPRQQCRLRVKSQAVMYCGRCVCLSQ